MLALSCSYDSLIYIQDLTTDVLAEQIKGTTLTLQFLQIGAKTAALRELCDRKDAKYQTALAEFNKSMFRAVILTSS
jgi:hypothetical protein